MQQNHQRSSRPWMTCVAPTHRKIAVDSRPIVCRTLSQDMTMKIVLKSFCETERNSFSMASRKALSAAAALTASMPLIASICCELVLALAFLDPVIQRTQYFRRKDHQPRRRVASSPEKRASVRSCTSPSRSARRRERPPPVTRRFPVARQTAELSRAFESALNVARAATCKITHRQRQGAFG